MWNGTSWDRLSAWFDLEAYNERFIAAGFLQVSDYNSDTGEIQLSYASDLYIDSYDSNTGVLTIQSVE